MPPACSMSGKRQNFATGPSGSVDPNRQPGPSGRKGGSATARLVRLRQLIRRGLERTASLWPAVERAYGWVHTVASALARPDSEPVELGVGDSTGCRARCGALSPKPERLLARSTISGR